MSYRNALVRLMLGDRSDRAFYRWRLTEQGVGSFDAAVTEHTADSALDERVDQQLRRQGSWLQHQWTLRLWNAGKLRIFSLAVDGFPACTGIIRDWSLHRRELGSLLDPAPILGPYWTDPDYRGRRLYGRLLRHTVRAAAANGHEMMWIWASTGNIASRKGIERAGFEATGCVRVQRRFFRLYNRCWWLSDCPATVL